MYYVFQDCKAYARVTFLKIAQFSKIYNAVFCYAIIQKLSCDARMDGWIALLNFRLNIKLYRAKRYIFQTYLIRLTHRQLQLFS